MNNVLREELEKFVLVYLDDIIVYSKTFKDHLRHVERVMLLLEKAVLQIKLKKCKFFQKKLKFLGHEISKQGIHTDPDKVTAMKDLPTPTCLKDIQAVIGLFQYYKNFILDFARIT